MGRKQVVEEIIWHGISFKRYPESKKWADANYYRPHSLYIQNGIEALHREIWREKHGPIPKGYCVHHKDENTANNDINNLVLIARGEHQSYHAKGKTTKRKNENLARIRPLAAIWHRSEQGKEWHSRHGKEVATKQRETRKTRKANCIICGKEYEQWNYRQKYCHANCKAKALRLRRKFETDKS
jgi:hypothetical protein